MSRVGVAVASAWLLLVGCGETPPPTQYCESSYGYVPWIREMGFETFPGLNPRFLITTTPTGTAVSGRLYFSMPLYSNLGQPLHDGDIAYCPRQDAEVRATIGKVSAGVSPTEWSCTPMRDGALCRVPAFELTLPADFPTVGAEVVLSDDSISVAYPLVP